MRCRFIGLPLGGIGSFFRSKGFVYVLDEGIWLPRIFSRILVGVSEEVTGFHPLEPPQTSRRVHLNFIAKHTKEPPVSWGTDGLLSIVHHGVNGYLGLAWSAGPLKNAVTSTTSKPPLWWSESV